MDITQTLRDRRRELGISQTTLARHCGLAHRGDISRRESGQYEWRWVEVLKACELLGLTIEIKEVVVS